MCKSRLPKIGLLCLIVLIFAASTAIAHVTTTGTSLTVSENRTRFGTIENFRPSDILSKHPSIAHRTTLSDLRTQPVFTRNEDAIGSLVVVTKNGTLELKEDSLAVLQQPTFGFLDEEFNYTSVAGHDDVFVLTATTADEKTDVEITISVSPSTGRYSAAYVGSTEDFSVLPDIDLTDLAGLIDGDLILGDSGWEMPIFSVDSNVVVFGSNSDLSEGIWVFQGVLNQEKADEILQRFEVLDEFLRWRTAFLILDNSVLDGGEVSFPEFQLCSTAAPMGRWRWREVLTGATVGAVVCGIVGSVIPVAGTTTGAIIGGAIGGALFGGGLAYVADREDDPDNLEDNYGTAVVCGCVGGAAGGVVGGVIGGGGLPPVSGGSSGGGPLSPYAKDWKNLNIGGRLHF